MNIQSNKKELVFEATLKLIAKHGLHNTPMALISKESKVAAGTIYHYFESKEQLINQLYLSVKSDMITKIMNEENENDSFKDRFYNVWSAYFDFLIMNNEILSFIEQCANTPIITVETQVQAEEIAKPLYDFLKSGIEQGELQPIDLNLLISLIHGTVTSVAKLHSTGQLIITEENKLKAISYSWNGLT